MAESIRLAALILFLFKISTERKKERDTTLIPLCVSFFAFLGNKQRKT
jgi:hypothetical protein